MSYFLRLYIGIFLLFFSNAFAQKVQVKKADKQYEKFAYVDAIVTYEKVMKKGYKTPEMLQKVADAYYFNSQFIEAGIWYAELFNLQPEATNPEYYYRYAQCLKSKEDYAKADEYLKKFYTKKGDDFRAELYKSSENYMEDIQRNSGRFAIQSATALNSEYSDYGTTVYNGKVIFASTRKSSVFTSTTQKWNNQPFSILYASTISATGNLEEPENFSSKLDSKFNEATPVFTKDGKTIYFTRNNYLKKKGKSSDGSINLKIYKATLIDGKWDNIVELPFNSDEYNVAHPALSPDEKTLYFVSDMPGSIGGADIWKVSISKNGTFGKPENLGTGINTEGKETFPFISAENELYFASDGHPGLGGLDIFVSKITDKGFSEPENIGKPINSSMDDFGFYIDANRNGFFSSNREEGQGFDDIYQFTEYKKLVCEQLLTGIITDVDTGETLEGIIVELYDINNQRIAETTTDSQGKYLFDTPIACDMIYRVRASQENYSTDEGTVKIPKKTGESELDLSVKRTKQVLAPGTDLRFVLGIPDIYFDLNKSNIRPDAEIELQKILDVMTEYPDLIVDIRSHTDCRASHAYNEKLSDSRAKASRQWLVDKGIAPNRLTAKGYGETRLVNHCADGVKCSEEEHQQNRRSEFIVVSGGE
jgi:outer membrane protein OmpA-like peptidoglycan-associated protein/tetratricopeptide (TPR) repeat protein